MYSMGLNSSKQAECIEEKPMLCMLLRVAANAGMHLHVSWHAPVSDEKNTFESFRISIHWLLYYAMPCAFQVAMIRRYAVSQEGSDVNYFNEFPVPCHRFGSRRRFKLGLNCSGSRTLVFSNIPGNVLCNCRKMLRV
jgi:hypothetical protein